MRCTRSSLATVALLAIAACGTPATDGTSSIAPTSPASTSSESTPLNSTPSSSTPVEYSESDPLAALTAPLIITAADGSVAVIEVDGAVAALRPDGWQRTLSLDGTYAVSTAIVRDGDTMVAWDALPSQDELGGHTFEGARMEVAATEVGGQLTAFVNPADEPAGDSIAGGRQSTTIVLAAPDAGEVARYELPGNFVPEAIGSTPGVGGLPSQVFLLEFLPADQPTRYRVQVLDTATGELYLPANLRDKIGPRIDQQMAGITRGTVLADEHGLLFTLYRGTSDMPDGHPYAFVHTLDLFDGVWCLDIPAEMELDRLPGAMAVAGDRLYVASANGMVGAYDIGQLRQPAGPVEMQWVTPLIASGGEAAPAIAADDSGAVVAWPWMSGLHTIGPDGQAGASLKRPDDIEALTMSLDGAPIAIGSWWWDLPLERSAWARDIERLLSAARG